VVLASVTIVVALISVSVGDFPVALTDVPRAVFGFGPPDATFVVQQLRLPRIICGVLVGASFGMSGAVLQSILRNELASPDVIGIASGASAGAVLMIVVVGGNATALSLAALGGGFAAAVLIYLLAYRSGVQGYRLILVGIGVAAGLGALTSYLILQADIEELRRANLWLVGSLNGRTWAEVGPLAFGVAASTPPILLLAGGLSGLQLGDDTAKSIGVRVEPVRAGLVVAAVALAAFGTAAAGPVAFVAFVAAPVARRLVGTGDVALLPSALTGALLLTLSDLVAREALGSVELPVGVLTGILGAPYLVWLLTRTNRVGEGA
jgi:iron complex transport system permease protein